VLRLVEAGGEDHADGVGADEARDVGQRVDDAPAMDAKADVAGGHVHGAPQHSHVRRFGDVLRVHAEEEVVHRRVADDDGLVEVAAADAGRPAAFLDDVVQALHDAPLKLLQPFGARAGVLNARDHVIAEGHLGIRARGHGQVASGVQVHEEADHRGRADVERDAVVVRRRVARLHGDEPSFGGHGGQVEPTLAERLRQFVQRVHRRVEVPSECRQEPVGVRALVFEARLRQGEMALGHGGGEGDLAAFARSEDLLLEEARRDGDLNGHVLRHARLTSEPRAAREVALRQALPLRLGGRRRAQGHVHPALAARAAPAAGCVEHDARPHCRLDQRGSFQYVHRPPFGFEDHPHVPLACCHRASPLRMENRAGL